MKVNEQLTKGYKLQQAGDLAGAEKCYRTALRREPRNYGAWCYLGMVLHDQSRYPEAERAYLHSLQLETSREQVWNNLANTLLSQSRTREALGCLGRALQLKPDYASAYQNLGAVFYRERQLEKAIAAYRKVLEIDPARATAHKDLGVLLLLYGRWEEGWREYAWRWKTGELPAPAYEQPRWKGSSLEGKTILLCPEQGLGDTIQFVRYAEELKRRFSCQVKVEAPRRLLRLLETCGGVDELGAPGTLGRFDFYAPLLDVPALLEETQESFPAKLSYLSAETDRADLWADRLKPLEGFRIGIAWQGATHFLADCLRSVPLKVFAPLGLLEGVRLVSLQRGAGSEQVEGMRGRLSIEMLGDDLDRDGAFVDTAAVMKNLDLVISVDTAVAHLAGALGVPVWLALPYVPVDWRWGKEGESTPWYPSMRLFRQQRLGDWRSVVETMTQALLDEFPEEVRVRKPEDFQVLTSGSQSLTEGRFGLTSYNRHDIYVGRSIERYGEFSRGESELFRQIIRKSSVIVEAGANIGAHTLCLAELAGEYGQVWAFEPQRAVFQILCTNVRLNGLENVRCCQEALGNEESWIHVPEPDLNSRQNLGGVSLTRSEQGEKVKVTPVDSLELSRCDFIKADVEGMELAVVKGAEKTLQKFKPFLYVENDRQKKSAALIQFLLEKDYRLFWHVVPLFDRANFYHNTQNEFSGVVSVNMIGVHRSLRVNFEGLKEIRDADNAWKSSTPPRS